MLSHAPAHTHGNQIHTHTQPHTRTDADTHHEGITSAESLVDQANRAIGACLGQPKAYACHRSSYD